MAAITDNAKSVYAQGSASTPDKADIVRLFGLIDSILGSSISGSLVGSSVVYQTRAALFANLARPADSLGIVYGDGTAAFNGYYVKSGASGSGSWTLTNLALPSTFGADLAGAIAGLAAVSSEVANARSGASTLVDRLNLILDTALDQSDNVLNYLSSVIAGHAETTAAIGAEVTAARQGSPTVGDRISAILNWSNEQDAAQNEYFNGRIDNTASSLQASIEGVQDRVDAVATEINASRAGSPTIGDRISAVLNWSNEQDAAQNEFLNDRIDEVINSLAERTEPMASRSAFADVVMAAQRPGEVIKYFTSALDGPAPQVAPAQFPISSTVTNGAAAGLEGAATIATVAAYRCEPGRQYRLRYVFQRSVDTVDPSNDAIRLGVRWLNKDKGGLSTYELANILDVDVSSGRLEYQFNISLTDDTNIDAVPPSSAVYFRPFVRTFGGGTTLVEVIEVTDLSTASEWSPDVSEYRREISGLQQALADALDRIQALEAQA